jgi:S1-C subfamily serine protease
VIQKYWESALRAGLFCITCVLGGLSLAYADVSPTTVRFVEASITVPGCMPNMQYIQQGLLGPSGTAFFVDKYGDFVTAKHVIETINGYGASRCQPAIFVPVGGWENDNPPTIESYFTFNSTACLYDREYDIAVCRPTHNPWSNKSVSGNIAPVTFETSQQPVGTDVAFSGFPWGHGKPVTAKASIGAYQARAIRVAVPDITTIIVAGQSWHGSSGSPLYIDNGKVVGVMVVSELGDASGLSEAAPASAVSDLVNRFLAAKK